MADLGFIGLGIMGKPMAGHLKNAGHTPEARQNLEEALKTKKNFDGRADAEALMKALPGG